MLSEPRRGTVLLIVVGLCAILLVAFAVVVRQMRTETSGSAEVTADAQARLMLPAAICFICESARLNPWAGGESFGWTDVRPQRATETIDGSWNAAIGPLRRADVALPLDPAHGNLHAGNAWPTPGTCYRADMFCWQRPPGAVRSNLAENPVVMPSDWVSDYESSGGKGGTSLLAGILDPGGPGVSGNGTEFGTVNIGTYPLGGNKGWTFGGSEPQYNTGFLNSDGMQYQWQRVWDKITRPYSLGTPGTTGLIGLQPVADTWPDFVSGELDAAGAPVARPGTEGIAWFRLYRELPSDHDGDGIPAYDRMALSGHGIFIIACGAGASRGYRDWAEVVASGVTTTFESEDFFKEIRAQERVLFYRVEWKGFTGGINDNPSKFLGVGEVNGADGNAPRSAINIPLMRFEMFGKDTGYRNDYNELMSIREQIVPINRTGTIAWIQRLDQAPPRW